MCQESSLWYFSEVLGGLVRFHEAPRLACNVYIAPRDTCTQMSACLQCQYSVHRCHHTERPHIPWPGPMYSLSCNIILYFRGTHAAPSTHNPSQLINSITMLTLMWWNISLLIWPKYFNFWKIRIFFILIYFILQTCYEDQNCSDFL